MGTGVRGLHLPLVTPFDEHGAVDLAALERLAVEVLDGGADGLVALATTAEASSLDERERDAVLAVCASVATDRDARGLGAPALLELAGTEGIVGLKQAVGGVDADTLELLAAAPADFAVLCGDDAFLLPLLAMGAAGAIAGSAHLCTERFASLLAAADAGRFDEARAQAQALLPLVLALFAEPSPAVLKAMLHEAGRIATPAVRMPLQRASADALAHARRSAPSRSSARAPARAR